MSLEEIEMNFNQINETIDILQKSLEITYLDAFIETSNNLLDNKSAHVESGLPNDQDVKLLNQIYKKMNLESLSSEDVRKVIQLVLLKATRQEKIQPNHQMTPDTIGFLVAFVLEKLMGGKKTFSLLDITVGSGNLLTTILNQMSTDKFEISKAYGVDNDDTMLSIAGLSGQLQRLNLDLFHQDAIDDLVVKKSDVVIADLPIGYYPLDERVSHFKTRASEGHSYVHHLLIEQSVNYLNDGGFGVYLVPTGLFETEEAKKLLVYIQENAYLQGMLNLPANLFSSAGSRKSILIIQKHGNNSKQVDKVLLGDFPSLKDEEQFQNFVKTLDKWIQINFNNR
ncbi:class I SAM-dependent methyltransferase [Dellaglioa carnosa]|uniref:Class I SAM-dependent methyltransferase n=1 Tax=Dellaglioa carnosa TaxID=2995136 RepID=A0ABT4JNH9_9LACO|nr:class I SAM-dependent methyltransferase [Dellaglioa carnosa]MCZ2491888.1 class I SAM-dependent methyltransferase [Dellaglioa carnosa]MCZ2494896.1 class I SAM-dependent methyltransferase [Dellaglioa carnosa]MDK1731759.1 class I SAM-dependent methyltransferase [Dellaglioa carnosa]